MAIGRGALRHRFGGALQFYEAFEMRYRFNLRLLIAMPAGIAFVLHFLAGPATAQSISFDNKLRPGSPVTGWSGKPSDPYSADPGKGAWITKAGLTRWRQWLWMM
jgi:hypothetical protein